MFIRNVIVEVKMFYPKEERLDIGGQIYNKIISREEAMEKYNLSFDTTGRYVTEYKKANEIALGRISHRPKKESSIKVTPQTNLDLEAYQNMTKEELIRELILSKANELRAKKGYEVKGDGLNKGFNSLSNKNSK